MKIIPYEHVSGVAFGASPKKASAIFGKPEQTARRTDDRRLEVVFPSLVCRFDARSRLVEVTASSDSFEIQGCRIRPNKGRTVAFSQLGFAVGKLDPASFIVNGFIVSPRFGIAFDPDQPNCVTAFSKSELVGWEKLA